MKPRLSVFLTALVLILPGALSAMAEGWESYKSSDYGFSMLVPEGTSMKSKEWSDGWAGLYAEHEGVTVYGVAKLGPPATAEDIEKFGVKLTGIPGDAWTEVDKGSGNGWKWYRTVKATAGSKLVFGGYGVGPKGSYLLLLVTTSDDFKQYRADYERWYQSIRLF